MMEALGYVITVLVIYFLGIVMFIRFGAFLHGCDNDMREMLRKSSSLHTRFHQLRKPRSPQPKPRLRAA
jgi:hypothetical protein